jgi:hypothetical protein
MRPICDFSHTCARRVDLPMKGVGPRRRLALRREGSGKERSTSFGRGSASLCRLLAQMRSADRARQCLMFGVDRTYRGHHETESQAGCRCRRCGSKAPGPEVTQDVRAPLPAYYRRSPGPRTGRFALSGQPTVPTAFAHIRVFAPAGGGGFAKDLVPAYEADLMVERSTCGESVARSAFSRYSFLNSRTKNCAEIGGSR